VHAQSCFFFIALAVQSKISRSDRGFTRPVVEIPLLSVGAWKEERKDDKGQEGWDENEEGNRDVGKSGHEASSLGVSSSKHCNC
jgi:hypothetical protein